jgi:hypothetical protein
MKPVVATKRSAGFILIAIVWPERLAAKSPCPLIVGVVTGWAELMDRIKHRGSSGIGHSMTPKESRYCRTSAESAVIPAPIRAMR